MNWFKGPIENAILQSKKDQLIFMVYVCDTNASGEMDTLWNNEQVYSLVCKECVCLRIESTSETFKQFTEIYKVLCLPSTFFLGDNGMPLEIIAGGVSLDDFLNKFNNVVKIFQASKKPAVAPTSESVASASDEQTSTKTLDEKVAEAREKIKALQQKKLDEEKEKERNSEMERRKIGQEILKAKQLKEELETKRLAEERKREKMNEELAKKRVLDQIQRDREEKQKKYEQEKQVKQEAELKKKLEADQMKQQAAALAAEKAQNSTNARIQFRLIDGSSIVENFESSRHLSDVQSFLRDKLRELNYNQAFTMHSMHPKRVFNDTDMSKSLKDLELAPTATILVMPSQNRSASNLRTSLPVATSGVFGVISTITSFLFIPVSFLWGFITGFFTPAPRSETQRPPMQPQPQPSTTPRSEASASGNTASDIRSNRSRLLNNYSSNSNSEENVRKREPFKKDGNIARLNGDEEDDSDTNTWNGNSTQQM